MLKNIFPVKYRKNTGNRFSDFSQLFLAGSRRFSFHDTCAEQVSVQS
jgi:hypothetical protein